jgi:hypothetical protein
MQGETLEVEQSVGGGASAPSADVKQPPLTAAEIVDRFESVNEVHNLCTSPHVAKFMYHCCLRHFDSMT